MGNHGIARQAQYHSTDRPVREFLKGVFLKGARQPGTEARGRAFAYSRASIARVPARQRTLRHDGRAARCSREVCGARPTPAKRIRSAAQVVRADHATVGA